MKEVLTILIENGRFGGHETFTPRYGWLKKGFDAFKDDGNVFNREDAIERLGVGKNMVRSIHHWCRAFKVIAFDKEKGREDTPHLAELGSSALLIPRTKYCGAILLTGKIRI